MADVSQTQVEEALKTFIDPYLETDLVSAKAIKDIKAIINKGSSRIDIILLKDQDIGRSITTLKFTEGPPLYMQSVSMPTHLKDTRFSVDQLESFYE